MVEAEPRAVEMVPAQWQGIFPMLTSASGKALPHKRPCNPEARRVYKMIFQSVESPVESAQLFLHYQAHGLD